MKSFGGLMTRYRVAWMTFLVWCAANSLTACAS